MLVRDVHPEKESSSIVDFLMSTDFSAVQPLKALVPMEVVVVEVVELLNVSVVREVHPLNASVTMDVMMLRFADVRLLQFLNALAPTEVYPDPKDTEPMDKFANAEASMVTDPVTVRDIPVFVKMSLRVSDLAS